MNEKKIIVNYLTMKAIDKLDELQIWQDSLAEKAKNLPNPMQEGQYALHRCMELLAAEIREVMSIIYEVDELLEDKDIKEK